MEKKYVSVELAMLKQSIVDAVNNSSLPYCIKQVAMQEILNAIQEAAQQEYKHDLAEIENAKKEEKEPAKED